MPQGVWRPLFGCQSKSGTLAEFVAVTFRESVVLSKILVLPIGFAPIGLGPTGLTPTGLTDSCDRSVC